VKQTERESLIILRNEQKLRV